MTPISIRYRLFVSRNLIQHAFDQSHLRLVILQVLTENLLSNLYAERSNLLADVGDGSPLLLFDGGLRITQETGTFLTGLLLGLLYDGVTRLGSFFENLRLTVTCLL